ncbi:MAG: hypothetical protein WCX73_04125 [Candidatus Pacearchaeota archaeon]|jgi:hypothetical protein
MKKEVILSLLVLFISLSIVSAINLDVKANSISNAVVTELNQPAVFDLSIKNLDESSKFEIYSLVGVDITPEEGFSLNSGETKIIRIKAMPQKTMRSRPGYVTFAYQIKDSENEIQEEKLTINVLGLDEAVSIIPENVNSDSKEITISLKNNVNFDLSDLELSMNSAFFEYEASHPLKALETKIITIPINEEKAKTLTAGNYLLNTRIKTSGETTNIESIIKFLEQEDIESTEAHEGLIIKRYEITKSNIGNTKKVVKITAQKNLFSYLFTTVNIPPVKTEIIGLTKHYTWEKELIPNEELKVVLKTNWFFPVIVILLIIGLIIVIKKSLETDLVLKKHVSYIKTKGGEFALKITIRLKAKKYIERINITDKLPPLVNLYERYGAVSPDKVDLKNKRMEWNMPALNEGEERIFSYIIYSKIGVVGRFELPETRAVYEKEGKVKNATSNRSFFINEPSRLPH